MELFTYCTGALIFALIIAINSANGELPKEVNTFFDAIFYCLLWPLVVLKAFAGFIHKLIYA